MQDGEAAQLMLMCGWCLIPYYEETHPARTLFPSFSDNQTHACLFPPAARPSHTIHHALGPVRKADLTGAQSSIPHTDASHSPYIRAGEEGDGEADLAGDAGVQGPVPKRVVQQVPAGGL